MYRDQLGEFVCGYWGLTLTVFQLCDIPEGTSVILAHLQANMAYKAGVSLHQLSVSGRFVLTRTGKPDCYVVMSTLIDPEELLLFSSGLVIGVQVQENWPTSGFEC